MRTLGFFDDSKSFSGTVHYLLTLLRGLDRDRYQAVVFSPFPSNWQDACRELGAEVVTGTAATPLLERPTGSRRGTRNPLYAVPQAFSWLRWLRRDVNSLTELFARRPVDLLHSNNAGEEPAPIAARRAGVPRIMATLHVDPTYDILREHQAPYHLYLQRRSLQALDLAVAVSARTEHEWRKHLRLNGHLRPEFVVVPNGIEVERYERRLSKPAAKAALQLPADAIVIGSIGRLDIAKGYIDLITALKPLVAQVPNVVVVHAGEGPLSESLRTAAVQAGVADHIRWLGTVVDVRQVLEACDLYVQPSWCEAHPFSILEAGACCLAVIATDVGGNAETLHHGAAGWLVPPRQPDALAQAMLAALQNPHEMTCRGNALGARVRSTYRSANMVQQTMELYDRL